MKLERKEPTNEVFKEDPTKHINYKEYPQAGGYTHLNGRRTSA